VHVLHRRDWAHFAFFLFPGLDAGAASEYLAARFEKLLGLFNSIKFVRGNFLVFNAFAHKKDLGLVLLPEAKVSIAQSVPACFRIVA
jgi:hypothetical protein